MNTEPNKFDLRPGDSLASLHALILDGDLSDAEQICQRLMKAADDDKYDASIDASGDSYGD